MTVGGALKAALRHLYEQSWRLLVLNVLVAAVAVVVIIVAVVSYSPLTLLLLAVVGPFAAALMHCAVTLQQTDRLRLGDGVVGLRLHWRRGLVLGALSAGTVSTNVFLRRLHNFALSLGWLLAPVLPSRQWPKVRHKAKRGITRAEHEAIIAREQNLERRAFYQLLWEFGGSQGDIAGLNAEDIDWTHRGLSYTRSKTGQPARVRFDEDVETLLRSLPAEGPLFPYLRSVRASDRATEFKQRCKGLESFES